MPVSPARAAAFEILLRVEQTDSYASQLLHSAKTATLSPQDHGLATELVMGVLRWRSALDAVIARFSSQKTERLDAEVLVALRMAAYQLLHLQRIPPRAAVHESVELVRHARKKSAAPFVNAILRKLAESRASVGMSRENHPSQTAANLAEGFAHPQWLVERWVTEFGLLVAKQICAFDQTVPAITIRDVTAEVERGLENDGIAVAAGALLTSASRVLSGDVTGSRACREGRVFIQDEGSQLVAMLAGKGTCILDCCAAPGGKTRILAERNLESEIVAVELHPHRARLLQKLVTAKNVRVATADIREFPVTQKFDLVLADVPCSGTGTLARNPEIKWRLKPDDLADLQARQTARLGSAMRHVTPGGRLIYSTCSLEHEENAEVVEKILATDSTFQLCDCGVELQRLREQGELAWGDAASLASGKYLRTIPGVHPCDGFFAAILQKN